MPDFALRSHEEDFRSVKTTVRRTALLLGIWQAVLVAVILVAMRCC